MKSSSDHADYVLLSIDAEEFDVPKEQGVDISIEDSMKVSTEGACRVLDIFKEAGVRATFFCTVTFAEHAPAVMERIVKEGHEVASHGMVHWQPQASGIAESKPRLEVISGTAVNGYREPRMLGTDDEVIERAGFLYNSSLHPTFIPGRYMRFNIPRTPFRQGGVLQIPASVTPGIRLPLFWLACHHYPQWLYKKLCLWTLHHDSLFTTYFHPWEFYPLADHREWRIPYIIRRNSGEEMARRLQALIQTLKRDGAQFITFSEYMEQYQSDE